MVSPLFRRFLVAPIVFLIISRFILFFINVFGVKESMYYVMVAILSVPTFLYIVIG